MSIYDDLNEEASSAQHLERCRRDFEATRNPLFAWEAWGAVRATWRSTLEDSIEIPSWLTEYFDACGSRLLGMKAERVELRAGHWGHQSEDEAPKSSEGPGAIGRSIGFENGLATARERWGGQFDERERRALIVVEKMWAEGRSLDNSAEALESTTSADEASWPERRTIRRYVERADRWALRRMQDRLREATGAVPERSQVVAAYSRLCQDRSLTN